MSHPQNTGNACTLEDCYTNLFALTDLVGIKWKRYTADPMFTTDPLEDPVLLAYTKCILSDVLCVWRRSPSTGNTMPQNLVCKKELWIFWYSQEPAVLRELPLQLTYIDGGCWGDGISYECRTLIFKALHNLIERCLLSHNFVRLGKWFVQPYDHHSSAFDKSAHFSIRFSFFLHGESQVCCSVDVRQHPPLRRLHPQHLAVAAQSPQQGVQVILAPHGLSGRMTGQCYRDQEAQNQLNKWNKFYPVEPPELEQRDGSWSYEAAGLPPVIEVIVAGVRMRHPTAFVLITTETESEILARQPGGTLGAQTGHSSPPSSPSNGGISTGNELPIKPLLFEVMGAGLDPERGHEREELMGNRIVEKVWHDTCISSSVTAASSRHQVSETAEDGGASQAQSLNWEFAEPMQKNHCYCSRAKGHRRGGGAQNKANLMVTAANKHGQKPEKTDKQVPSKHSKSIPYHRRMTLADDILRQEMDQVVQRVPNVSLAAMKGTVQVSVSVAVTPNGFDQSMDSPNSAAPSPLDATPIQPSVASQNGDPTMPTLSPHPPSKNLDKDLPGAASNASTSNTTHGESQAQNSQETVNNQGASLDQQPTPTKQNVAAGVVGSIKTEHTGQVMVNGLSDTKSEGTSGWSEVAPGPQPHKPSQNNNLQNVDFSKVLKRPRLPSRGYDEREPDSCEALYDFASINEWLEQPLKIQRLESRMSTDQPRSNQSMLAMSPGYPGRLLDGPSPPNPVHDPYEFSDESSFGVTPKGVPSRYGGARLSREDSFSRQSSFGGKADEDGRRNSESGIYIKEENGTDMKSPGGVGAGGAVSVSLTREDDLKVDFKDLDHIFDETDSDDDHGMPSLNQGSKDHEEKPVPHKGSSMNSATGVMGPPNPGELSRMYPTPPSHEYQLSPPGSINEPIVDAGPEVYVPRHEPQAGKVVKPEDPSRDWSYVFKPPVVSLLPVSSKYLPINLPSVSLDPLPAAPGYKPSHIYHSMPQPPPPPPPLPHPNIGSVENVGSVQRPGSDRIEQSPATFLTVSSQRTPRTPMSVESPASNASSSFNKNLPSVDNYSTNNPIAEANSLMTTVMLTDSMLNLFKDHNFDSCTICVCNMNIHSADYLGYVPDKFAPDTDNNRCTCGFSAAVNRKFSSNSGLFFEDETDISGYADYARLEYQKPSLLAIEPTQDATTRDQTLAETMPQELLVMLQGQFSSLLPSSAVLHNQKHVLTVAAQMQTRLNLLEYQDGCEAGLSAVEAGRQCMENYCPTVQKEEKPQNCLHRWPFLQGNLAPVPANSADVVRVLKSINPLLHDAIQKKRTANVWEMNQKVTGPVSWKDFHLLAGRGSDEVSSPQPMPRILVGSEKERATMSPLAIKFWDKLLHEPCGQRRDVVYIVVAPDNDYVLGHVQTYFKELSAMYELCRLGRHRPIKKLREGIMRFGRRELEKLEKEPVDNWFDLIGTSPLTTKLKLYAQICRHQLAPFLLAQQIDQTQFDTPNGNKSSAMKSQPEPSPAPPPTPESAGSSQGDEKDGETTKEPTHDTTDHDPKDAVGMPAVVVYMVDPFSYGTDYSQVNRIAMLGLLRCHLELRNQLSENLLNNIQLQIVPLSQIMDFPESITSHRMKSLSMSVYTQCRRVCTQSILGRTMTGFGPAAGAERLLKEEKVLGRVNVMKIYSPPFILAKTQTSKFKVKMTDSTESSSRSQVLFCTYCLSEDQRWLLAVCTDDKGELMETCTINIEIPNRRRRKHTSARKIALGKLWDFLLGVISVTNLPWRLVIGRFGRVGHGELKGWAGLLSRKNLQKASSQMREMCPMCPLMNVADTPCILSACLVSLEVHESVHIMTDMIKEEDKASSNVPLSTPRDSSCTHILVVPTSTSAQSNDNQSAQDTRIDPLDTDNFGINETLGVGDADDLFNGLEFCADDINNMFSEFDMTLTGTDSMMDSTDHQTGSPVSIGGRCSPSMNGPHKGSHGGPASDVQDESSHLLQQPLALGFYVSTAKTGPLPHWFWSHCPQREFLCPTCLKAALHIHTVPQTQDDLVQQSSQSSPSHPLDSTFTCDVLRYVLETYNALSWLTVDPQTSERRSCLPVHMLILCQLYHAFNTYI